MAFPRSVYRQAFEVNNHDHRVLEETVPVSPTDGWGTNLRYHDEPSRAEVAAVMSDLDVLWHVRQTYSRTEPVDDDLYRDVGFCPTSVHEIPPRIELTRFDRCGGPDSDGPSD